MGSDFYHDAISRLTPVHVRNELQGTRTYTYCTVLCVYYNSQKYWRGFNLSDFLKTAKPPNLMPC